MDLTMRRSVQAAYVLAKYIRIRWNPGTQMAYILPANSWMWRGYAADTTCSGPGLPDIWQGARRQEDPDIYWSILTMNVNF